MPIVSRRREIPPSGHAPELRGVDPWRRFRAGIGVLVLVLVGGTFGYAVLGLDLLDAFYQTVITISTVGYREVGEVGDRYQLFTVLLILFGTGTSLYTLSVLIETMFEGRLNGQFRRHRMRRKIDRLTDHVVLCGYGEVGRAIETELLKAGEVVVAIDQEDDEDTTGSDNHLRLRGDATDDRVILQAGLDRAKTLIVALDSDTDNLYIALTARSINPHLFIVARANRSAAIPKLRQVGADRVVDLHQFSGARMAALVANPEVSEFLDFVMQGGGLDARLGETRIGDDSPFSRLSLGECAIRAETGANVLAVRRQGSFMTHLSRDFVLMPDDILITLGTSEQLKSLGEHARKR